MRILSKNAYALLKNRYLKKNANGAIIETVDGLFKRVSEYVANVEAKWGGKAEIEEWQEKFYQIMSTLQFLPNSPTLMNAGNEHPQLSACFVLPISDSINSIDNTIKNAKKIQIKGGGIGFNFSQIAPKNNHNNITTSYLSGPISIIEEFNQVTGELKKNSRRGANMAILDVNHPDIESFISAKQKEGILSNFNLSVAISDEFMTAVDQNDYWELIHPIYKNVTKVLNARTLWKKIAECAWTSGDPAVLFIDTINQGNTLPKLGPINATNPCGEVPLLPNESCNLGSLNLTQYIKKNNSSFDIHWRKLEENIYTAVRFLDNVIEANEYINKDIREITLGNRKIGLGVMGWADLLILLEIPYESEKAIKLGGQLMQFIQEKAMEASEFLASKRGVFPNWDKSIYANKKPIRNATRTSIAPTGSISIIANTSPSIEPIFALAYEQKNILNNKSFININKYLIKILKENQLLTEDILKKIVQNGIISNIKEIPISLKKLFKTALEISPEWHLKHQLAFQKFTENAVSKTINLPESTSPQEIASMLHTAYVWKAKGVSVYRYNSKKKQVLYKGINLNENECGICKDNLNPNQVQLLSS